MEGSRFTVFSFRFLLRNQPVTVNQAGRPFHRKPLTVNRPPFSLKTVNQTRRVSP